MTLAIHHALRTSERATRLLGRFQLAPRLNQDQRFMYLISNVIQITDRIEILHHAE